jgi:glutamate decarboxylase
MLAGLAFTTRWQHGRQRVGASTARPNIVMGIDVQICWEKFANFCEVEPRYVPMKGDRFIICAVVALELVDENTIGVVAILGSTFDGSYEPVAEVVAALDELQERTGLDVPVHLDGPCGAMIAPFLDPSLVWGFRLPRVAFDQYLGSQVRAGVPGGGWIVWRDTEALPEDLVFRVNYLGRDMPTFALNFSRPGAQAAAQYYNFIRLGSRATVRFSGIPERWRCDCPGRSVSLAHSGF